MTTTHPYDLPRLKLSLSPDDAPDTVSWADFLAEPEDPGQWALACLMRAYVITTCPYADVPGGAIGQGSWNSEGIKITWPLREMPDTYNKLKALRAGFGHHEPDYVVLADGPPLAAFKFVRSMSLDEISGYFVTDWTQFAAVYKVLSEAALERGGAGVGLGLIAATQYGSEYLKAHNYTERVPDRRCGPDPTEVITDESPVFIARVPGAFRCPVALGPLLGVQ